MRDVDASLSFNHCYRVFYYMPLTNADAQYPQGREFPLYAPNAASPRNLAKVVVAAAVVLGLETAEILVTQHLVTRGTRACRLAEEG